MDSFSPLTMLSRLLGESSISSPVSLRESGEIDRVLAEQQADAKTGGRNYEPKDLQIEAVQRFWSSEHLESFRDARLVSFGLTVCPWGDSRCVMEDSRLFGAALDGVSTWRNSPRQFRKCFQGLARSYFDYDVARGSVPPSGKENWGTLRDYLKRNVTLIKDETINPDWVDTALENQAVFTETPCEAFGREVLEGDTGRVDSVRQLLSISDGSWFTRELVMAQLIQAARREDHAFPPLVNQLLSLVAHNDVLRDSGMKLILDRYASIPQVPQHVGLKEQVVNWWGNPWLPSNQDRWGGVSEIARDMVSNWLKGEFIELFFTKLAQDGLSDTRRVRFWQKYIPSIDTIQFALGSHALYSKGKDFVELREKLKGLLVGLDDVNAYNNAFIMRIGDLLAVEFSGASNAFYGYSVKRNLPFDLSKTVRSAPVNGKNSLKNDARVLYLRHQDGVHGYTEWEDRFKDELQTNFGIKPGGQKKQQFIGKDYVTPPPRAVVFPAPTPEGYQGRDASGANQWTQSSSVPQNPPSRTPLPTPWSEVFNEVNMRALTNRVGGSIEDNRSKGGALWIRAKDHNPDASRVLRSWGFTYKLGKGWWKDAEG